MYQETYVKNYSTNNRDIRSFLGYEEDYQLNKIPDDLIAYLRKSRKDEEIYGNEVVEETLARHLKTLQEWAVNTFGVQIPDENIKKEVVSGETIAGRPVMQETLKMAESPRYKAIVCVDVQRLGRGDLEEQGKLTKFLRFSDTKILTPNQWFNLENKFDRKFFENKMRESNEYLEYSKDIMGDGRIRSVLDSNYPHSVAPYGFKRQKIQNRKGYTLIFNTEEYKTCKLIAYIFINGLNVPYEIKEKDTYSSISKIFGIKQADIKNSNKNIEFKVGNIINVVKKDAGTSVIANYLNFLGLKSRTEKFFSPAMVRNILTSMPAHGFVSWNRRKTVKTIKNGEIISSRPINKENPIIVKGNWEPIYSPEESMLIKEKLKEKSFRVPKTYELKNPLVGLVRCGLCNSKMQRRPYYQKTKTKSVRAYKIDKIKLQKFLRTKKGNLSINEISRLTNLSRDIISHIFALDPNRFTIPKPEYWELIKSVLKIKENPFDEAITTFKNKEDPHVDTLVCNNRNCKNISSDLILVEEKIIESLKYRLCDYKEYLSNYSQKVIDEVNANKLSLELLEKKLEKANNKLNRICGFLEDGTYTKSMFFERKNKLDLEISDLIEKKKQFSDSKISNKYNKIKKAIPILENVINNYYDLSSVEQKNKLLSLILEKVEYTKILGGKSKKDNFNIKIYLKY